MNDFDLSAWLATQPPEALIEARKAVEHELTERRTRLAAAAASAQKELAALERELVGKGTRKPRKPSTRKPSSEPAPQPDGE